MCIRDRIDEAVQSVADAGPAKVVFSPANMIQPGEIADMVGTAANEFGGLDILVNNAGIAVSNPDDFDRLNELSDTRIEEMMSGVGINTPWAITENLTDEDWHKMIDVHLTGTFYCAREALRRMSASGRGGTIINMSSIAGLGGLENVPHYCACLLYTSPSPRDATLSRMPSSA